MPKLLISFSTKMDIKLGQPRIEVLDNGDDRVILRIANRGVIQDAILTPDQTLKLCETLRPWCYITK